LRSSLERASGIKGVSGEGTLLDIETGDNESAKRLQEHLLNNGVLVKATEKGVALRPSLTLDEKHVDQFSRALSSFK